MTFWEWAGAAVIAGLSGGVGLKLVSWIKEHLDRKARKLSYHAKAALEQADEVCGRARAMNRLFSESRLPISIYAQASLLWRETTPSILNVWEANAWVLDESEHTEPLRQRFRDATEQLRQRAVAWDAGNRDRCTPRRLDGTGGFVLLLDVGTAEDVAAQREARQAWQEAYDHFLKEFQALHNALQPMVREYSSSPDVPPESD